MAIYYVPRLPMGKISISTFKSQMFPSASKVIKHIVDGSKTFSQWTLNENITWLTEKLYLMDLSDSHLKQFHINPPTEHLEQLVPQAKAGG